MGDDRARERGEGTTADEGITRRRMIGYLIAAPTLMTAVSLRPQEAQAAPIPSLGLTDAYDLSDLLKQSALPTAGFLVIGVGRDGNVSFAMPRAEVGQGITTAVAMVIADEMDVPIERVEVTLADADPRYGFNQLTGGSSTIYSIYEQVRLAAAAARRRLVEAAADEMGGLAQAYRVVDGFVVGDGGIRRDIGEFAESAAVSTTRKVRVDLKPRAELRLLGAEQKRLDARAAVTGEKVFATDLDVPDALPTMVCRPPTINGSARSLDNRAEIEGMPGVTDVVVIPHTTFVAGGVAVRARTFGQCIDAIRRMKVTWRDGSAAGRSNDSVLRDLRAAQQPMTPALPGSAIEEEFVFHFRPGDPVETNTAVADVRADRAEVWSCLKTPGYFQQQLAESLRLPREKVVVHVTEGGGSFGRHLFADAAFEAAEISRRMGKPVKLMWARSDNTRQGRVHPMAISRIRVVHTDDAVVSFDRRHVSVQTDYTHGLGELLTSTGALAPGGNFIGFSQGIWNLTADVPYNFGLALELLNEIYEFNTFNTSSVRNIYGPEIATARELMVDATAAAMRKDPVAFRREYAKDERTRAVIDKAAEVGGWGRTLPDGVAQGFGIHREYKSRIAVLAEVDVRDAQKRRKIKKAPTAYTGPRVTRIVIAVDVGQAINALGLKAQMMGGAMDAIAQVFSYGLHLEKGAFLEASWSNAHYTRQWNTPPELEIVVMPPTTGEPGGAGELGVPATMAAIACAVGRATGRMPTEFPLNFREPLTFEPFPQEPPIPAPPSDGLRVAGVPRPRRKKPAAKKKKTTTAKRA